MNQLKATVRVTDPDGSVRAPKLLQFVQCDSQSQAETHRKFVPSPADSSEMITTV